MQHGFLVDARNKIINDGCLQERQRTKKNGIDSS